MAVPSSCQLAELHQQLGQLEVQLNTSYQEAAQQEELLAEWRMCWNRQSQKLIERLEKIDGRLRQLSRRSNITSPLKVVSG